MSDRRLLFHGCGDLLVLIDDHAYRSEDIFQRLLDLFRLPHRAVGHFMAGAHSLHSGSYAAVQPTDHLIDFLG
ncbi:Uncharacterised protein [Mycobacterium tuberculosis]|nr:Uncharacterised protein [Mycobacterium tuberculosis]